MLPCHGSLAKVANAGNARTADSWLLPRSLKVFAISDMKSRMTFAN
jgi:hypothetical protein